MLSELYVNYHLDIPVISNYVKEYKRQDSWNTVTNKWFDGVKILGFNSNKKLNVVAWRNINVYSTEIIEQWQEDNNNDEESSYMFGHHKEEVQYNKVFKGNQIA